MISETLEKDNLTGLVDVVTSGHAVLVVGSGLSRPEYPSWKALLQRLIEEAQNLRPQADPKLDLKPTDDAADWIRLLDVVRSEFPSDTDYFHSLASIFVEPSGTKPLVNRLVQLPFKAFVTTNYDLLLEWSLKAFGSQGYLTETITVTTEDSERVNQFMTLLGSQPSSLRSVLHLHGVGTKPSTIILTATEYQRAYGEIFDHDSGLATLLGRCLWTLLYTRRCVFVGFGLQDPFISRLLEIAQNDAGGKHTKSRHYIILPSSEPRTTTFENLGIDCIYFNNEAKDYQGLKKIVEAMHAAIPTTMLPLDDDVYAEFEGVERPLRWGLTPPIPEAMKSFVGLRNFLIEYLGTPRNPRHFSGRERDLKYLDKWLEKPSSRYLVISAPSGRGKSALLVNWMTLLRKRDDLHVIFVPISARFDTNSENLVFWWLAMRLAPFCGLSYGDLSAYHSDFRSLVPYLLARLGPSYGPVVVILDGLDEAKDWEVGPDLFPKDPPKNLRIVLSIRGDETSNDLVVKGGLDRSDQVDAFYIDRLGVDQVRLFVEGSGAGNHIGANYLHWIHPLCEVSEGDPFLLRLMIDEALATATDQLDALLSNLSKASHGHVNYLQRWWNDQEALWGSDRSEKKRYARDLMAILTATMGPIRREELLDLLASANVKLDLREAITALSRFVVNDNQSQGLVLAHPRFSAFFRESFLSTEPAEWERRIVLWGEDKLRMLNEGIIESSEVPQYLVSHYAAHLERSPQADDKLSSILSPTWRKACLSMDPTDSHYLANIRRVMRSVGETNRRAVNSQRPIIGLVTEIQCATCISEISRHYRNLGAGALRALVDDRKISPELIRAIALSAEDPERRAKLLMTFADRCANPELALRARLDAMATLEEIPGPNVWEQLWMLSKTLPAPYSESAQIAAVGRLNDQVEFLRIYSLVQVAPTATGSLRRELLESAISIVAGSRYYFLHSSLLRLLQTAEGEQERQQLLDKFWIRQLAEKGTFHQSALIQAAQLLPQFRNDLRLIRVQELFEATGDLSIEDRQEVLFEMLPFISAESREQVLQESLAYPPRRLTLRTSFNLIDALNDPDAELVFQNLLSLPSISTGLAPENDEYRAVNITFNRFGPARAVELISRLGRKRAELMLALMPYLVVEQDRKRAVEVLLEDFEDGKQEEQIWIARSLENYISSAEHESLLKLALAPAESRESGRLSHRLIRQVRNASQETRLEKTRAGVAKLLQKEPRDLSVSDCIDFLLEAADLVPAEESEQVLLWARERCLGLHHGLERLEKIAGKLNGTEKERTWEMCLNKASNLKLGFDRLKHVSKILPNLRGELRDLALKIALDSVVVDEQNAANAGLIRSLADLVIPQHKFHVLRIAVSAAKAARYRGMISELLSTSVTGLAWNGFPRIAYWKVREISVPFERAKFTVDTLSYLPERLRIDAIQNIRNDIGQVSPMESQIYLKTRLLPFLQMPAKQQLFSDTAEQIRGYPAGILQVAMWTRLAKELRSEDRSTFFSDLLLQLARNKAPHEDTAAPYLGQPWSHLADLHATNQGEMWGWNRLMLLTEHKMLGKAFIEQPLKATLKAILAMSTELRVDGAYAGLGIIERLMIQDGYLFNEDLGVVLPVLGMPDWRTEIERIRVRTIDLINNSGGYLI